MHDEETKPIMAAQWCKDKFQGTSLSWLQDTSYNMIDHVLICAFVERWHEETSSFHLLFGEMTVTLDDVACLLHLLIDDMLLSHGFISWDEAMEMMETYLGSDPGDALIEVEKSKGAHCRFGYLQRIFKERLKEQLVLEIEHGGMTEEVQKLRYQVVRIYLLYLVGVTLFIDKSQNVVDVVYLRYFRDLDLVVGYSWGVAAFAHLYRELNNAARWNCSQVVGYLTLLQV